jgi:hypothetical protein
MAGQRDARGRSSFAVAYRATAFSSRSIRSDDEPLDAHDRTQAAGHRLDRPAGTKENPRKPVLVELDFAVRFPAVQLLVAELAASFTSANARLDR